MQKLIGLRKGVAAEAPPAATAAGSGAGGAAVAGNVRVAPPSALPLDIGYDLAAPAIGFSARKAYWLACASAAAYSPRREIESLVLQTWRFHRFEFFEQHSTQGFLAADDKIVLVAFRGTELSDLQDVLDDAQATFTPFGDDDLKREVHSGFDAALARVSTEIEQQIVSFINPVGGKRARQVFITGHSLGGALATLMFARLMLHGQRPVPTMYTYGCPRVGNSAFARELDRSYPERIHRIVNETDIVPNLPPLPAFHHAGRLLSFDSNGSTRTQVTGLTRILDIGANAARNGFKNATAKALDDHGIAHYAERCEKLARTT
jgi:triacylglycerol lipase